MKVEVRAHRSMEDVMRDLVRELEKEVPEDVRKDLAEMSRIGARIDSRLHSTQAISLTDVRRWNDLCYKHFGKVQDGGEFTKEEPEETKVEKRPGGIPTVCDEKAIDLVHNYIINHLDKSDPEVPDFAVFIVWKAKILQNWKWLISSTIPDGMYYELTYNGDKEEYYLDAYRKVENKVIRGGALE